MDDMANEFADMLQETIARMAEKIEVSAAKWEGDASLPMLKRVEDGGGGGGGGGGGRGAT
jgi:hypothetical protein